METVVSMETIRVLYVEDNSANQMLLSMYVRGSKFTITPANNVKEGLKEAEEYAYPLIIVDLNLTGNGDGVEFIEKVRRMDGYEQTPVYVLSAMMDRETIRDIEALENVSFLQKPIMKNQFMDLLHTHFKE